MCEERSNRLSEMELASLELEVRATDLYDAAHAIATCRPVGVIDRAWWLKLERALKAYYETRQMWRGARKR